MGSRSFLDCGSSNGTVKRLRNTPTDRRHRLLIGIALGDANTDGPRKSAALTVIFERLSFPHFRQGEIRVRCQATNGSSDLGVTAMRGQIG